MGIQFYQDKRGERGLVRHVAKWIADLAMVFSLAIFLVQYTGMQYQVSGHAMEPGLKNGDVVLIDRISYRLGSPRRLDVVLFQKRDGQDRQYLKRIIGLPGETVQIVDGRVCIDGAPLDLPDELARVNLPGMAASPVLLGEDEYFLLGDNRDSSEDSRFENIGNISRGQIIGRAWFRASPLDRLGFLGKTKEQ